MVFGWKGAPVIINMLISIIGAILITASGYVTFAPFAMLIGAFIAGLLYKDARDGAVYGLIAAVIIAGIIGIFSLFIFFIVLVALVLWLAIPEYLAAIGVFYLILLIAALLSPIIGAIGGLFGSSLIGEEVDLAPPTTQPSETPPNTILCPSCGTLNVSSYKFCVSCGSSLKES